MFGVIYSFTVIPDFDLSHWVQIVKNISGWFVRRKYVEKAGEETCVAILDNFLIFWTNKFATNLDELEQNLCHQ